MTGNEGQIKVTDRQRNKYIPKPPNLHIPTLSNKDTFVNSYH